MSAEIIDLAFFGRAQRCLDKLLKERGLAYFLKQDAKHPFRLDATKVELVLRAAARLRPDHLPAPSVKTLMRSRQEIRRQLIQQVAQWMLQVGL
jgi:hypothetical protein